jgi:cytochrome c oxidase subunit IV
MSTEQSVRQEEQVEFGSMLWNGALLMALAGVAFIGYGIVFLVMNFVGSGFELGVSHLGGMTAAELDPTVAYYISHLHVATAAFIISTGIAVAALSWFGVRQRLRWAWATALVVAVTGLAIALPMHYFGGFAHDWVTHLGPIYLATVIFVVGVALAYKGMSTPAQ